MKTVFTNQEICHVFNYQDQYEGRTANSNLYFYGKKLYSYGSHYLLAEFLDESTLMINDEGYSNTTARHISLITDATSNNKQFFKTKTDYKIVNNNVKEWLKKVVRARKSHTINYYMTSLDETFKMYFEYLEYSKQKTKHKKYKEHREILKLSNQFYSDFSGLEEFLKIQQKKQDKKDKLDTIKKVKDWKTLKISWFNNKTKTDFLRINGENVETSQGIKIPIEEAKRLLRLIDAKKIIGSRVNDTYTITAFNGFLRSGCHNIPIEEINFIRDCIK